MVSLEERRTTGPGIARRRESAWHPLSAGQIQRYAKPVAGGGSAPA